MIDKQSEIEFQFAVGHCNGSMSLEFLVDDIPVQIYRQIESESLTVRQLVDWPSKITIVVSGKNLSEDTVVDPDGKILKDKYIELKAVKVDRVDLGFDIAKKIILDTGDTKINSQYWGFNGKVHLHFDQKDSFLWHLSRKMEHQDTYVVRHGPRLS